MRGPDGANRPHVSPLAPRWSIVALLATVVSAMPAAATHAPDHRFILIGFVTDGQGRPLTDLPVVVTRVKTGLAYQTRTEGDGLYFVIIHLHDEDQGESLRVSANRVSGEIRASFDMRDKKVERGTRVDVRGDQVVERRESFAETLRAYLAR